MRGTDPNSNEEQPMGNPAGVRRKKKEKRRKKFEERLGGPLAYVSKEVREEIKALAAKK